MPSNSSVPRRCTVCVATAFAVSALLISARPPAARYHLTKRISVDSEAAVFLAVDASNRRLYGAGSVVIDIDRDAIVGKLPPHPGRGFAVATDLGYGISRAGMIFDLKTLDVLHTIDASGYSVTYDRATGRAFLVGASRTDTQPTVRQITAIDPRAGSVLGVITLPSEPEDGISDGAGRLYVAAPEIGTIFVIDARVLQITERWKLDNCPDPGGLAVDARHGRLFVSCENSRTIVLNVSDGRMVSSVVTHGQSLQSAFDPGTQLLFNPSGRGVMTVIHEDSPNAYSVVETVDTAEGTSAAAVDENTHRVYLYALPPSGVRILVFRPR